MNGLRLVRAGPWVSIQDLGRRRWQRYGVSESGAMDWLSLRLANRIVGNQPSEAALEVSAPGLIVAPDTAPLTVAAVGPSLEVWLDETAITGNRGYCLQPGQTLRLRPGPEAVFAYLAVAGGFATPEVFGSRSFHGRSGIGGTGLPLSTGTVLPTRGGGGRELRLAERMPTGNGPIAVIEGPQHDHVDPDSWATFLRVSWRIHPRSDRMGIRLDGPALRHSKRGYNLVSDGIVLGSVQLPGNGQPIVLAADRQTTGGYPKFSVIPQAEMLRFVQRPYGQIVNFRVCTVEEAVRALGDVRRWVDNTPLCPADDLFDSRRLLSVNLIDGVISA